ncbi:serine/threonine kinase-like domain-containing protein STKLD1 isoform X2 [Amia ocellicauda]|uniref:serine/threonine kinase-like domain-containing protein STKLD1 isoform X2 n=1 Tax=Amia ocellicauda TaxID=2972642 RepID=UPI00346425E5
MEKYRILDVMEPGSYGTVHIVRDRSDGHNYTMKRVECLDVGRANRALEEALCLLELQHPHIIKYKELLITWDRKVIRGFLGQMLDTLAFLHKQKIIHRNLKPSNILMTKDLTFMLSDFGTPTLTQDELKLEKRMKESEKSWMAPEIFTLRLWSEKSDIWSLGCILLEMLICHMLDAEASLLLLQRIRKDSQPLEVGVSPDLSSCLQNMLERNPERRASVWELLNEPFVKVCLVQCGSRLVGVKKKLPPGLTGAPSEGGIKSILELMENYKDVEEAQLSGLEYLLTETADKDMFSRLPAVVQCVTSAMRSLDCVEVQRGACQVLHRLLIAVLGQSVAGACLRSEEVVCSVLNTIHTHSADRDLLTLALPLILILSADESSARRIAEAGGIQEIVRALRRFSGDRDICLPCCEVLWSLVVNRSNSKMVSTEGTLEAVSLVGETHLEDGELMETVCAALWSLTLRESLKEEWEDTTLLLMHTLNTHTERQGVVKYATLALASLVSKSELAAFRVLLAPSGGSGVRLISEACLRHHDDPEVVENICNLFSEMAQYDDVIPELMSENVKELLQQIQIKFASNKEIVLLAESTLANM